MNKLMGFYELKELLLPSIKWNEYTPSVVLNENSLWTIRSAVNRGDDLNLPRLVGKSAQEAKVFADDLYRQLAGKGMVTYYPYFIAHKSGTLNVFYDKTVIEAVNSNLWNMVTNHELDTSLVFSNEFVLQNYYGKKDFITAQEINKLKIYAQKIRSAFREEILEGKSILLEWSIASDCDIQHKEMGEEYLIFYEIRSV